MSATEANDDSDEQYIDETCGVEKVEAVIKSMLTENTGRHFLDSGDHYGRHHEENNRTPPWEKDRLQVDDDYVIMNVYHYLCESDRGLERDGEVCEREREFYRLGARDDGSWLNCMEAYAKRHTTEGSRTRHLGVLQEEFYTVNTYNHEFGTPSQTLQFTIWTEGDDQYILLQIHQGADVRGGYTKPRLFRFGDVYEATGMIPGEYQFYCYDCQWGEAESVLDHDVLRNMTVPDRNMVECPECGSEVSVH